MGIESFQLITKILSTQFQWEKTSERERLSWKMGYSMILAYNTKWVSGQLFGCRRTKPRLLGREHLHHLMFITELLLVKPSGYIDPHITDKVTKPSQAPWIGSLPTWMWRLKAYLRYKMRTSQNVSSEEQVNNFFILCKSYVLSQDIQVCFFLTIPWFTKSVMPRWVLVNETGCIFEFILWTTTH